MDLIRQVSVQPVLALQHVAPPPYGAQCHTRLRSVSHPFHLTPARLIRAEQHLLNARTAAATNAAWALHHSGGPAAAEFQGSSCTAAVPAAAALPAAAFLPAAVHAAALQLAPPGSGELPRVLC